MHGETGETSESYGEKADGEREMKNEISVNIWYGGIACDLPVPVVPPVLPVPAHTDDTYSMAAYNV